VPTDNISLRGIRKLDFSTRSYHKRPVQRLRHACHMLAPWITPHHVWKHKSLPISILNTSSWQWGLRTRYLQMWMVEPVNCCIRCGAPVSHMLWKKIEAKRMSRLSLLATARERWLYGVREQLAVAASGKTSTRKLWVPWSRCNMWLPFSPIRISCLTKIFSHNNTCSPCNSECWSVWQYISRGNFHQP
jgi:hypothetical protein